MLKEAYEYGQRLAAAEKGYAQYEEFLKEAGMLSSVGRTAWNVGSRGALAGAGLGAAGNIAFGDQNQGVLERGAKGALGGAAVGGALGAAGGAAGQSLFRTSQLGKMKGAVSALPKNTLMQNGKRTYMGVDPAARAAALKPFENRPNFYSGLRGSIKNTVGQAHAGLAQRLFG